MNRINLTKYGFVRSPEDDFSDDGNRFTCYKVGNVRVSKIVSDGRAYISARRNDYALDYEDYSKLPHYKAMDRLDGVSVASLTEEDLIKLYNDCLAYDAEYDAARKFISWPTVEELAAARHAEVALRQSELAEVEAAFTLDKAAGMTEYALKNFFYYYKSLKSSAKPQSTDEEWAKSIYGTPYSKSYMRCHKSGYNLQPSCYRRYCLEYLAR